MPLQQTLLILLRLQWIEIRRTHLIYWSAGAACLALGFAYFVRALALTESTKITIASAASLIRLVAVLLTILFCAQSICRDLQDKTHLNILAKSVSKTHWLLGKMAGCLLISSTVGIILGAILLLIQPSNLMFWSLSFILELGLVSLLTGLFSLSFKQIGASIFSTILLYLAGRLTHVFTELALSNTEGAWWENLSSYVIRLVDLILPKLSAFASTDWLIYSLGHEQLWINLGLNVMQTLIYACLILFVGIIDLKSSEW